MEDMGLPLQKQDRKFTCGDYQSWPPDERWEIIEGTAYDMSPAPSSLHQRISGYLQGEMYAFLKGKPCSLFAAPFDVYLSAAGETDFTKMDTVIQPDLSVICDGSKIIGKGCLGAPDLTVEILSPFTSKKDLNEKFRLYEKYRVREYWVVDPGNRFVQIFHLLPGKNNRYDEGTLFSPAEGNENSPPAVSLVLEGFSLDTRELFGEN